LNVEGGNAMSSTFAGSGNKHNILSRINTLALQLFANAISFAFGKNSIFGPEDVAKVLIFASIRKLSVEGSSEELDVFSTQRICSPDVIQRRTSQLSIQQIEQSFENTQKSVIGMLKKMRLLFGRMTIAIDFTDILYYGDKNDPGVVRRKSERGTTSCFRYATLSVVIGEVKLVLQAHPVNALTDKTALVDTMLTEAKNKIRVNLVLVDRGFFSVEILKLFDKHKLKFIMPIPKNSRVKKMIKHAHKSKQFIARYEVLRKKQEITAFNIFFMLDVNSKEWNIWKRYHAFGTNIPVTQRNMNILADIYRKRWNIETSYRVEKHEFLATTTSKSYQFRLLLFLLSVLLYNLWMILKRFKGKAFHARRWKLLLFQCIIPNMGNTRILKKEFNGISIPM
jgi:hypothetical protein